MCGTSLALGPTAAACANAHTFDRARNGYLNLLLSNKKQSAEPGDSVGMLQSRRAFLQRGYYDQMAAAAVTTMTDVLGAGTPRMAGAQVADLGCGEGFFTARIKTALTGAVVYGVDISRPGIKMAAAHGRDIHWIVASLHRSPFLPASLSVALSVFAPIDAADVRRVIRDDGALVTVTPGPDHLQELRKIIYSTVKPHPPTPALMAGDTLFAHASSTRVRHSITLESQAEINDLVAMTPYYWHISASTRAAIAALQRLELTVDAYVNVFRPK